MTAIHALMHGLIDYAGLFPPAGLDMPTVVENYADYQTRDDHWALGRLVVPVARLDTLAAALEPLPGEARLGQGWPITALLGTDPVGDMAAVALFNERYAAVGMRIEAVEGKVCSVAQVRAVRTPLPTGLSLYLELPLTDELPVLVDAVKDVGALAKIRTGGVHSDDIPSPEAVLTFLELCADAALPFKATAGLHHPLRSTQPLTYLSGSANATMFGYLNVFLAATALWLERPESEALTLLTREDGGDLMFTGEMVRWGASTFTTQELAATRRDFAHSVGSCSFLEPLTEIRELGARLESIAA